MKNYICVTCGTQFEATNNPPKECPVCVDERQYINWKGQQWTTLSELNANYKNRFEEEDDKLIGIGSEPSFAINQRALFVKTSKGNILWDCIANIDNETVDKVNSLGGIKAIAISHPHYYSTMIEWSKVFGNIPIYLHADDKEWVMRDDPVIKYWEGDSLNLWEGLTLIKCGGHFEGGTVLHFAEGADGKGALLTGDIIQIVMDRKHVSFMRSYPNLIPLSAKKVIHIQEMVADYKFEEMYGAWWNRKITKDAKKALEISVERYIKAIRD